MEEIKNKVRGFILSDVLGGESPANLKNDTPLQGNGILDSISTLRLIQFIERAFDIEVSVDDANSSNFRTIDSIAAYVMRSKPSSR